MFGRFRKTNDPARDNDGGAVAVSQREREIEEERAAPATNVATPPADPAARERRLEELRATQADDPDTRGLDRERVVQNDRVVETDRTADSDRFAHTGAGAPVTDRDRDVDDQRRTVPAIVAEDTVVAMRARQRD